MHVDVVVRFVHAATQFFLTHCHLQVNIKKRLELLGLDNIVGIPAREQALTSQVRNAGSSVRNAYRKEVSCRNFLSGH